MKHSERFENAITKLYNAFHKGELKASDCAYCAVGNICDNDYRWNKLVDDHGSGIVSHNTQSFIGYKTIDRTGYSAQEILNIEKEFISGVGRRKDGFIRIGSIEDQFNGLCAVVKYLCELEGIENIMDYQSLFNPKRELELTQIF